MGQPHDGEGHEHGLSTAKTRSKDTNLNDFVLEKSIFANIFEKDIRRVFIYKKAERLAKAIHLVTPAFADSLSLKDRMDRIAVGLVDAAVAPSGPSRAALARELLALSSVLSVARTAGLLSPMNVGLMAREAHLLLQDIADYEEPRILLDDAPTLAGIARVAAGASIQDATPDAMRRAPVPALRSSRPEHKRQKDTKQVKDRREAVLSAIRNKGHASIKDISTLIRNVSEKTIQRELSALIEEGVVLKKGERRWSVYFLV